MAMGQWATCMVFSFFAIGMAMSLSSLKCLRASSIDLAVGDRLGVLGHRAVLVVLDHACGSFFGCGEIVFVERGGYYRVAFEHVVGVGFVAGCSMVVAFFRHDGRGGEGEADEAECECWIEFHFRFMVAGCSGRIFQPVA